MTTTPDRILIVEDDADFAEYLIEAITELAPHPMACIHASSLAEARELLSDHDCDSALLDLGLPDAQGLSALHALRQHALHLPIVILTGHDDQDLAQDALAAGADDYLIKGQSEGRSLIRALFYARARARTRTAAHSQRLRNDQLGHILKHVPVGAAVTDGKLELQWSNRAFHQLSGLDGEQARLSDAITTADTEQLVQAAAEHGEPLDLEVCLPIADNQRWVRLQMHPFHDEAQGPVSHFLVLLHDTNEQHRLEDELRAAARRQTRLARDAQSALKAKTDFLAGIGHDLRTPLSAVIGMAESLRETQLDREQLEAAQLIHTSANDVLRRIDRILTFARQGGEQPDIARRPFSPSNLVRSVVDSLARSAETQNLDLHLELGERLPDQVIGDGDRIRLVLVNLLANAIAFTQKGHVTVVLDAVADADPPRLRLQVRDTGPGMPESRLADLFSPFSGDKPGSQGLGLAICASAVELMGGSIAVDSTLGEGTTFEVRLPVSVRIHNRAGFEESPRSVETLTPREPHMLPRRTPSGTFQLFRLLVVEDDPINQKVICTLLRRPDCTLDVAANGAAALSRCRKRRYDAIFMDCRMPVMDGLEATRALRTHERATGQPRTPVIGVTAENRDRHRDCIDAGMDAVIAKPISRNDLFEMLKRFLALE